MPPYWLPRHFEGQVLTVPSFDESDFVLETRFRLSPLPIPPRPKWDSDAPVISPVPFGPRVRLLLGVGPEDFPIVDTGYAVDYHPRSGSLQLRRADGVALARARVGQANAGKLKVVRRRDGRIEVYLDAGKGYPARPQLTAKDLAFPELGRLGLGFRSVLQELFVDWIRAEPIP